MAMEFDRSIIGTEFDRTVLDPVKQEEILEYAAASGEPTLPAADGAADVGAPPTFVVRLRGRRFMPANLPKIGRSVFDAGKDIEFGVPIRAGDVLTVVSTVHDIYEKTGRTGNMAFIVLRTVVTNQRDEQAAVIDQKMMFR
ncbi:MAG: MaoC family dehydratase N-terminal domain-containing protein [Candidatus Binatia bacterium]